MQPFVTQRVITDPLSRGARESLGTRLAFGVSLVIIPDIAPLSFTPALRRFLFPPCGQMCLPSYCGDVVISPLLDGSRSRCPDVHCTSCRICSCKVLPPLSVYR